LTSGDRPPAFPPGLRPEARVFLESVARFSRATSVAAGGEGDALGPLLESTIDWPWLLELARLNKVSGLLFLALKPYDAVPAEALAELQRRHRTNVAQALILLAELDRVLDVLYARGITVLPYKGPLLAEALYPSVGLREAGDLDLLVLPDDVDRVTETLLRMGYEPMERRNAEEMRRLREHDCELTLVGHGGRIFVEVHWELMPRSLALPLDIDYIAVRTERVRRRNAEVLTLPAETLALVLCAHAGVKHDWSSLRWLVDIARLLASHPDLDVPALLQEARRLKIYAATAAGLLAAHHLAGAPLKPEAAAMLRRDRRVAAEAAVIHGRVFRAEKNLPGYREWRAYLNDGASADRPLVTDLIHYLRAVASPRFQDHTKDVERMRSSLAAQLVRPWRLVKLHGPSLLWRLR
jgi:Uncharacterised nucleotidyltransferase